MNPPFYILYSYRFISIWYGPYRLTNGPVVDPTSPLSTFPDKPFMLNRLYCIDYSLYLNESFLPLHPPNIYAATIVDQQLFIRNKLSINWLRFEFPGERIQFQYVYTINFIDWNTKHGERKGILRRFRTTVSACIFSNLLDNNSVKI